MTRTVAADSGASTAREILDRSSEGYQRLAGMLGVNDELMRKQIEIHEVGKLLLDPVEGRDSVMLRSIRERVGRAQAWFGWSNNFGATPVDRELAPLVELVLPHLAAPTLVISPDDPLHRASAALGLSCVG